MGFFCLVINQHNIKNSADVVPVAWLEDVQGENAGSSDRRWPDVLLVSVSKKFGSALAHVALKRLLRLSF